jgi:Domain of unknown function (DUF4114)/PEP-CTERM motif
MKRIQSVIAGALFMLSSSVMATVSNLNDHLWVQQTGDVFLTFVSKEAGYSNDLFLTGNPTKILNNQTAVASTQYALGNFTAGTELVFSMFVNQTGHTFFSGPASRNLDNTRHTTFSALSSNSVLVGFEDLFKGGDFDYNDLRFSLTNVVNDYNLVRISAPVPEPESYMLMGLGLLLVSVYSRKRI